ncbi:hypothetical protein roselon_02399 [Roseibacterium elongatum DSM 19469]|uniref:Uncharacterized protein n=1 Tax=Roseicyclus elongatus DSM 19469 TaxID=1294273 RepID=W8S714_9RHOB|nr:hypothetical protein roselon_02399 [Roseibacterium elongatum DSM 19469]
MLIERHVISSAVTGVFQRPDGSISAPRPRGSTPCIQIRRRLRAYTRGVAR